MLEVKNLHVSVEGKQILQGVSLNIQQGEVHAIMGPNGSGKSTLSSVLAGKPGYTITAGEVRYQQHDLLAMTPDARALAGIYMAFQYPVEIPGVSNVQFLKAIVNAQRKQRGEPALDAIDFLNLVREKMALLGMDEQLLYRGLNEGFSGGEKKRNEILQMLLLSPQCVVMDETDSGLDIDALQTIAHAVNTMRSCERSFLMITHYQRLLRYIEPDYVHVLARGRIVRSGGKSLAHELEEKGYAWLLQEDEAAAKAENS